MPGPFAALRALYSKSDTPAAPQTDLGLPAEYFEMHARYASLASWYTGKALDVIEVDTDTREEVEPYPLRLNPLPSIVEKHVAAVIGVGTRGVNPIALQVRTLDTGISDQMASWIKSLFTSMISRSGKSTLQDFVRISQIYGGFAVRARINENGEPVWDFIHPMHFFAIPNSDYSELLEAWIIRVISANEAKTFGYPVSDNDAEAYYYTEHWTKDRYEIKINDRTAIYNGMKLAGENPYGFVPFVYVPHIRGADFWGESVIEPLTGLIRELNARFADFGNAVNIDSTLLLAMRNIQGAVKVRRLMNNVSAVDLGSFSGVAASGASAMVPDLFDVRSAANRASQPMKQIVDDLWEMIMRAANIPPVAYGEDEGSQRSALTLEVRFWPLIAHANQERRNIEDAFGRLIVMTVEMLRAKRDFVSQQWRPKSNVRISLEHFDWVWDDQLPRDMESLVNMLVLRRQNNLGTLETLLELLPDINDPKAEAEAVFKELERMQKINQPQQIEGVNNDGRNQNSEPGRNPGSRGGSDAKQGGADAKDEERQR